MANKVIEKQEIGDRTYVLESTGERKYAVTVYEDGIVLAYETNIVGTSEAYKTYFQTQEGDKARLGNLSEDSH